MQFGEVPFLGRARIERIEIVDSGDIIAARGQSLTEVRPDESGRAGDQDTHDARIAEPCDAVRRGEPSAVPPAP